MTDEQMWKEASDKMYESVRKIEQGKWFDDFNCIQLFNIYLIASILYYRHPYISIMSDSKYDSLCRYLLVRYDLIKEVIWNKELLNKKRLAAGTGFDIDKYPTAIYCISQHYMRK